MFKPVLVLAAALTLAVTVSLSPLPQKQSLASHTVMLPAEATSTPDVVTEQVVPTQQPTTPPIGEPTPKVSTYGYPIQLSIPSIGFNNPVITVGVDAKGDMDVPSGKTSNVGWYKDGTIPGKDGSAVIGAHVFAAFKNLHTVQTGDSIYVMADDGTKREFKVTHTKVHELSSMVPQELFNRTGGKYLHLITCAGQLTADGSTYTHRLVVYATLVE